jgi:hypothetical protein
MIAVSLTGFGRGSCTMRERCAKRSQPGCGPHLKRQERYELRQRHDRGIRPAGIKQRLQGRCSRIARAKDQ